MQQGPGQESLRRAPYDPPELDTSRRRTSVAGAVALWESAAASPVAGEIVESRERTQNTKLHFSPLKAIGSYVSCLFFSPHPFFSYWPWHDHRLAGAPRDAAPWSLPLRLCQHPPSASLASARRRAPSPAVLAGALVPSQPPRFPLSPPHRE